MCHHPIADPQVFGELNDNKGRLGQPLGYGKRGNFLLSLSTAFWALQGWPTFGVYLTSTSFDCYTDDQAWDSTGPLVSGPLSHAGEDLWMLPDYQTVINSSDGSGL
jgi:hypothetical protein